MAVGQTSWYHFGVLVYFSGDWDVHWGYGLVTHGHMAGFTLVSLTLGPGNKQVPLGADIWSTHLRRVQVRSCSGGLGPPVWWGLASADLDEVMRTEQGRTPRLEH